MNSNYQPTIITIIDGIPNFIKISQFPQATKRTDMSVTQRHITPDIILLL